MQAMNCDIYDKNIKSVYLGVNARVLYATVQRTSLSPLLLYV